MSQELEETLHRLGIGSAKDSLWLGFAPSGHDGSRTWQMTATRRGRGGKRLVTLLQTTALRPLGTVTIQGQSYPLTISWHERKHGGAVYLGGERKLGQTNGLLRWEMRWEADKDNSGRVWVEMRAQTTLRQTGDLHLSLHTPLHAPKVWSLGAAAGRGHCAQSVFSDYGTQAIQFVALEGEAGWDEEARSFEIVLRRFPLGGGKKLRFGLDFRQTIDAEEPRAAVVTQYVTLAEAVLHPLPTLPMWEPQAAVQRLTDAAGHAVQGAERLYLRSDEGTDVFYAGFPHYPLEALEALWNWHRLHPSNDIPSLVRYGATGIATDFQVMGQPGGEPNKGAFWDKISGHVGTDFAGAPTHGIAANARIAQALFRLHAVVGGPLLRQSALNICQWLMLKMNSEGSYDGAQVRATQGIPDDGRIIRKPCALDGIEAITPFVLAFRATQNEVFIKAAWKIANAFLKTRAREFESAAPPAVAAAIRALIALDAEAPNTRLRAAIGSLGAWLRTLPLLPDAAALNPDGLHCGLYDCAQAGFALCALLRDAAYARYAWFALSLIPSSSREKAWRELALLPSALLSITAALPDARPDFDAVSVAVGWRVYVPDAATDKFIRVQMPDNSPVHFLPLVSRQDDQMLLLVLAPSTAPACVTVLKNGRRPLVRDLISGQLDSEVRLHSWGTETWGHIGLFTIDP